MKRVTGHTFIKNASVGFSRAGLAEVWAATGEQLVLSDNGRLCVSDYGNVTIYRISARDIAKMERLEVQKNSMMSEAA